ncbi:interleukin-17 receptor B [Embiotoca jacksoni]|uniref:interleukin-17 receptor B n=1 Tax=Embiotoca jacksoni TaxID=100190 RepID=UPI003703E97D
MMWAATLIFFSYVAAQVTSTGINVKCEESVDYGRVNHNSYPSLPADLKVNLVTEGGEYKLNISWAIQNDGSIHSLEGTEIEISGKSLIYCEYDPPFNKAGRINSTEIWFQFLVSVTDGLTDISVSNLPASPRERGLSFKHVNINVPRKTKPRITTKSPEVTIAERLTPIYLFSPSQDHVRPADLKVTVTVTVFGGLAGLMILTSFYLIYKRCRSNVATAPGFKSGPGSPMVPVSVLVVYPAENSAFQQAIVALAEFLQWHGGCSVAIDMWQQEKIAELGPMCWLAEQAKAADRVLIVCPSVQWPSHHPSSQSLLEPSIPAAAHDLYPLILNMVASHAKVASELAKFWVVQLGEQQQKRPCTLAPELRACKTFCLMKDLNKVCKSLPAWQRDDKNILDRIFRARISYSDKSTVKLREAVEKLREPLQRAATIKPCGHHCWNICNEI